MTCDKCGTELKKLLTSTYCPNEDQHGKTLLEWVWKDEGWTASRDGIQAQVYRTAEGFSASICRDNLRTHMGPFEDDEQAKTWCAREWESVLERMDHPAFPYVDASTVK